MLVWQSAARPAEHATALLSASRFLQDGVVVGEAVTMVAIVVVFVVGVTELASLKLRLRRRWRRRRRLSRRSAQLKCVEPFS